MRHSLVITRRRATTNQPRVITPAPATGPPKTRGGATAGAMAGVAVVPTTEVAAAVTVKYLEKQAAHHAPFFMGTVRPYCQI
jgi:hypothetical protein